MFALDYGGNQHKRECSLWVTFGAIYSGNFGEKGGNFTNIVFVLYARLWLSFEHSNDVNCPPWFY